jgi:glycosyltransferase involved in cell wall biosynthesis
MAGKLCVFPNDPLDAYYKKGEVKERYFNPENLFDEVHVITLADDDIAEEKVQTMAGNALLRIHTAGRINLKNIHSAKKHVLEIVQAINPSVIRSYSPLIPGWLASYCSSKLQVPLIVSLHTSYDADIMQNRLRSKKYASYFKLMLTKGFTQSTAIQSADRVICAYRYLVPYAKKYGAKNIDVIYNQVDRKRFSCGTEKALTLDKPMIICVGNLTPEKNQECLIRAIRGLDVYLLLVGDGELYDYLNSLAKETGIEKQVIFVRSVPHSDIHKYYASATIFALPMCLSGIAIPILEALSSGLPVVIPKQDEEDIIDDVALFVDNTPESFREAFEKLLSNPDLIADLGRKGKERMIMYDAPIMEEKEASLYKSLLK